MKTCTKCGEEKPLDEYYKHKSKPSGYETACKACTRARTKKYADANRDAVREKKRAHYRDNGDHVRALASEWRSRNREKLRERQREWRVQNPNYEREYREGNEQYAAWVAAYNKERYANNRDEILAKQREAYAAQTPEQREAYHARSRAYRLANMHVQWESHYRLRAKKYGHQPSVTSFTREQLIERHGDECVHCGGPFEQLDHYPTPVANGGEHSLENCVPSCAPCNKRSWQGAAEFAETSHERFGIWGGHDFSKGKP